MDAPGDIVTIDCQYRGPQRAASYLILEGREAAFCDVNTVHAQPLLLEALANHGLGPDNVRYLLITHAHLDHAAGAGALLARCPNAMLLCHPVAARHLINPARLEASARKVYGDETFDRLYGRLDPIPAERVSAVEDGATLDFGGRTFTFLHTPGHARHHMCIHDSRANAVFTGDTFGVRYPALGPSERPFLLCSTAPTDFDPEAAIASVERIVATGAEWAYPTHFGPIAEPAVAAQDLLADLRAMAAILTEAVKRPETGAPLEAWCLEQIMRAFAEHCARAGVANPAQAAAVLDGDLRINAQGLAFKASQLAKG